MRIFVLGNGSRPGVAEEAGRLLPFLRQHVEIAAVDLRQEQDLAGMTAELALVLGGDGGTVSRFSRDGLTVSTPIGSTGHNLSAGGPILGQELPAFVITPICPHTLTNRPVVESADKVYTIVVRRASAGTTLILDGQD